MLLWIVSSSKLRAVNLLAIVSGQRGGTCLRPIVERITGSKYPRADQKHILPRVAKLRALLRAVLSSELLVQAFPLRRRILAHKCQPKGNTCGDPPPPSCSAHTLSLAASPRQLAPPPASLNPTLLTRSANTGRFSCFVFGLISWRWNCLPSRTSFPRV